MIDSVECVRLNSLKGDANGRNLNLFQERSSSQKQKEREKKKNKRSIQWPKVFAQCFGGIIKSNCIA